MLQRKRYIERVRPLYDNDSIKLITGIRQTGKSVLMRQIRDELEAQGKKIIYIDFADPAIAEECRDVKSISSYIAVHWRRRKARQTCYVFFDDVQKLANWSVVCRALTLSRVSLFVAGSGAPLLTPETTRNLAGNCAALRVRPFVYKELRDYAAEMGREASVEDYVQYGGFPKRLECADKAEMLRYLSNLDAEAFRDAIVGCKIRRDTVFRRAADFVLTSNGQPLSANAVHSRLKKMGVSCSINTVMNYLDNLEAACLVRRLPTYSALARRNLNTYAKFYDEDVAFHMLRKPKDSADSAANLENIVYNELIYMGYTLSAYAHRGGESIDFLAEKDGREYLVQAAESIAEKGEREKKLRLLNTLDNSRKKLIITNDEEDYSTSVVEHIRLKDFLMMEDLRG